MDGLVFAQHKLHWLILQLHWDEIGFRILPFDISNFTIGFPDNSIGTNYQLKDKSTNILFKKLLLESGGSNDQFQILWNKLRERQVWQ